jgi:hypothetical protein
MWHKEFKHEPLTGETGVTGLEMHAYATQARGNFAVHRYVLAETMSANQAQKYTPMALDARP